MSGFTRSVHCQSRAHCATCRLSAAWRTQTGAPEECPHGITLATLPLPAARTRSYKLNADGTRCATCPAVGG